MGKNENQRNLKNLWKMRKLDDDLEESQQPLESKEYDHINMFDKV